MDFYFRNIKKAALLSLSVFLSLNLFGQETIANRLASLFEQQLKVFPQEKIYLHTDKPYYISGEQIWFRAYLVDAATHIPVFASRYIYVELINPLDTVVARVKIQHTDSVYCGHIDIPPDLSEGDYTLRAYTNFMQSLDENYWYAKNIHIGNTQARDIPAQHLNRKFVSNPVPDDDFDVTFYPEGGVLLEDTLVEVAFKALKSNGKSSEITGVIYDNLGEEITPIKTDYSGMGILGLYSEKGKTYYAVCTNEKGKSKRFDLPAVYNDRYDLCVNQRKDNLYISVLKPAAMMQQDTLYLLAHTRGVVYYADRWPNGKTSVVIPKNLFPSGVLQLLILDARLQPLSERLVFIRNDDQAKVDFRTDKDNYAKRSLVQAKVTLTDRNHEPLTGNFSVSVTDDNEVITDTCNNILTSLLLTSDLRGHIECPASYFDNSATSSNKLDLLMLTQGWRRYDVPALLGGTLSHPAAALEIGAQISGTVKNIFTGKAAASIEVSIFSPNQKYFDKTKTDKNGRFSFINFDLPDSTQFIVHAEPNRGLRRMEINIDQDSFPKRTLPAAPQEAIDRNVFAQYADKAEQKYTYEHGMRMIHLKEVTITAVAKRNPEYSSVYYETPDYSVTEADIDKSHPNTTEDIYNLLRRIPGVRIIGNHIEITPPNGSRLNRSPMIYVDGWPESITDIVPQNIAQIDVLKNASILGMRGANGAIFIYTKIGEARLPSEQPHVKFITPLGYQKPAAFYSPKYDIQKVRENSEPDLRTTISWKPDVEVNHSGKASFDFYTADSETTYTVILEGITSDGKIIHEEQKITRNDK